MAGWFVDIFVEWIVRMIAKLVHRVQSRSWPHVQAIITAVRCERAGYGCHLADVHFDYEFEGTEFSGLHEEPFLVHDLGTDYCLDHPAGTKAPIRVNPHDPKKVVFLGS